MDLRRNELVEAHRRLRKLTGAGASQRRALCPGPDGLAPCWCRPCAEPRVMTLTAITVEGGLFAPDLTDGPRAAARPDRGPASPRISASRRRPALRRDPDRVLDWRRACGRSSRAGEPLPVMPRRRSRARPGRCPSCRTRWTSRTCPTSARRSGVGGAELPDLPPRRRCRRCRAGPHRRLRSRAGRARRRTAGRRIPWFRST